MTGAPVQVFVLDDHEVVRDGLRMALESAETIQVVGDAASAAEARTRVEELRPDVAIVDIRLPDASGIEVIREIRSSQPETQCIVFTSYPDDTAFVESVLAGAAGFLNKDATREQLVGAVLRVARGDSLIDHRMLLDMRGRTEPGPAADDLLDRLTPHEVRILHLVTSGLTNREVASRLGLAEKTVRNYVSNILAKVGMRNRTQLAAYTAQRLLDQVGGGR